MFRSLVAALDPEAVRGDPAVRECDRAATNATSDSCFRNSSASGKRLERVDGSGLDARVRIGVAGSRRTVTTESWPAGVAGEPARGKRNAPCNTNERRRAASLIHGGASPNDVRCLAGLACRNPRNAASSSQCMSDQRRHGCGERTLCAFAELYSSTMLRIVSPSSRRCNRRWLPLTGAWRRLTAGVLPLDSPVDPARNEVPGRPERACPHRLSERLHAAAVDGHVDAVDIGGGG